MDLISFNKKINIITYRILNFGSNLIYMTNISKSKKYRAKNKELYNIHKGETCYIIGNGPSIKQMNLSPLGDKIVFAVNGMIKTPLYDVLKPDYYCIYDREAVKKVSFDLERELDNNRYNTKFILHRSLYDRFAKYKNTYFIYSTKICTGNKLNVDITKNCNIFINVVPFVIRNAIYMGFKRIVLLGCDFSFFASRKNAHFYDVNAERKESLYQDLSGCAIALLEYQYLHEYCKDNNIELVNCTPGSLLDVIPQKNIEQYL